SSAFVSRKVSVVSSISSHRTRSAASLTLPKPCRVIVASAVRHHYVYLTIVSDDPTLQGIFASICTQIELNYSILATSISCLGPFLSPFTKNPHVHYIDTPDPHSAGSANRSATDCNLQA